MTRDYEYRLLFTGDDVQNPGELTDFCTLYRIDIPVAPSVLIYELTRTSLCQKDQATLRDLQAGTHIDLFHPKAASTHPYLGPNGKVRQTLDVIEGAKENPVKFAVANWFGSILVNQIRPAIESEIKYQAELTEKVVGKNSMNTYHYGLHYWKELYKIFAEVSRDQGIPFRYAPQYYRGARPQGITPDYFLDQCNGAPTSAEEMGRLIRTGITQTDTTAELCLHLGGKHGYAQVEALKKLGSHGVLQREYRLIQPAELHGLNR